MLNLTPTIFIGATLTLLLYWIIKRLSQVAFKPLTSHWFALGVTASFSLGSVLFYSLVYLSLISLSNEPFEIAEKYFLGAWLLGLIPLNLLILPSLYYRDKIIAVKQDKTLLRIPENALHALTFCGGYLGAWIGQSYFKHKTAKSSFQKKHYLISFISAGLYSWLAYTFLNK